MHQERVLLQTNTAEYKKVCLPLSLSMCARQTGESGLFSRVGESKRGPYTSKPETLNHHVCCHPGPTCAFTQGPLLLSPSRS